MLEVGGMKDLRQNGRAEWERERWQGRGNEKG